MSIVERHKRILKFTHYFSAQHTLTGKEENYHPHTFTITIHVSYKNQEEQVDFNQVNSFLNEYFRPYTGEKLNLLPCFKEEKPTIEVMGNYFYEDMKLQLEKTNLDLIQLDICENPLRVYSASDNIVYVGGNRINLDESLDKLQKNLKYNRRER